MNKVYIILGIFSPFRGFPGRSYVGNGNLVPRQLSSATTISHPSPPAFPLPPPLTLFISVLSGTRCRPTLNTQSCPSERAAFQPNHPFCRRFEATMIDVGKGEVDWEKVAAAAYITWEMEAGFPQ